MSSRKKISLDSPNIVKLFSNWLSQLCAMLMTRSLYLVAGRGSAKTTDIQVERFIEMMHDMPGAPVVWVSDTYTNLQKNVLRTVIDGLEMKGYKEGIHYVIGKAPPVFKKDEIPDHLPAKEREHFWKPYNSIISYKNTMVTYTGFNVTFGSLDRPASLAGNSYVHMFGDEVKYFLEHKISNLMKAIRGYRVKYGNSPFYRGHTLTTDMPNPANVGEHDWILKMAKKMKPKMIMMILKTAFVVNEAIQEYIYAKENGSTADQIKKKRVYERWNERWISLRMLPESNTFFYIASSYVNADILTPEYFQDEFDSDMSDVKTAILSMRAGLESGQRFYANLAERHFYADGNCPIWSAKLGLLDEEDCRILKYLDKDKALDGGADFGNMMSLIIAQEDRKSKNYRGLKFMYTLSPEWIRDLADKFLKFFAPHQKKVLNLYYDRAANNYKKAGQDLASQLKNAIEYYDAEKKKRTGWRVVLMSEGQGNIGINEEYNFMQELFAGKNPALPKVAIDQFHCKQIKCSLEKAKAIKNSKGQDVKDKSTEKLPLKRLPLESTNPSDSFKYLMMRRNWRVLVSGQRSQSTGTVSQRG